MSKLGSRKVTRRSIRDFVSCYGTKHYESQSPGNELAVLLDSRVNLGGLILDLQTMRAGAEQEIADKVIGAKGFEHCVSVNWKALDKMFDSGKRRR